MKIKSLVTFFKDFYFMFDKMEKYFLEIPQDYIGYFTEDDNQGEVYVLEYKKNRICLVNRDFHMSMKKLEVSNPNIRISLKKGVLIGTLYRGKIFLPVQYWEAVELVEPLYKLDVDRVFVMNKSL